ncbi:aldehyde dehydrogenase, partial [Streptomyces lasiicapitis]
MASTLDNNPVPSSPDLQVPKVLKAKTAWPDAWERCLAAAPEAFRDDRVLNLWAGRGGPPRRPQPAPTPRPAHPHAG